MALNGTGTTVAFQSGLFAEILSAEHSGMERTAIPTSHFGTTGTMTYEPADLIEGGEFTVEIASDGTDDITAILGAAAETVTITWPVAGSTVTWSASCFCTAIGHTIPFEDRVVGTYSLKVAGPITVSVV